MATLKQMRLVTTIAILAALTVQALPAKAVVYDAGAVRLLQARYEGLKSKEYNLLLDYDEVQKQIDYLKRKNDRSLDRRIDDLYRMLDAKYADLQRLRMDLRDVELKLM